MQLTRATREFFCGQWTHYVVVLAVTAAAKIDIEDLQLWVAFGTGPHFRYIPAHEIAKTLGPDKSCALTMFHAYTGCDTVSSFATKGKKTAWDTWKAFGDVTPTFLTLSTGPAQIADEDVALLELFTILLYDRTSNVLNIDEARLELFTKRGRAMESSTGATHQAGRLPRRALLG